jgi:hypothetical protein
MPVKQRVWDAQEEEGINWEVLEGTSKATNLGVTIRNIAHHYVFTNTTTMASWVKYKMNRGW